MFNENKEVDGCQSFDNLPSAIIKIPVNQSVAALILHLCKHRIGAVNISLEELRSDGAQLVISSIVSQHTNKDKVIFGIYENDELKNLKRIVNELIEEKFAEDDEKLIEHYKQLNEEELENERVEQEIIDELEKEKDIDWGNYWDEGWVTVKH